MNGTSTTWLTRSGTRSVERRAGETSHMPAEYSEITERSGDPVTSGQIADMHHRYRWASERCAGLRVLEVACGTGQGLGMLARHARSVVGCDLDAGNVAEAKRTYGERIALYTANAEQLPASDSSVDVVLLFEAIYYLPDPSAFLRECRRVLAPGGLLLLTSTNNGLFDFSPSPLSHHYYGAVEFMELFADHGFSCKLWGYSRTEALPLRHRLLRPVKALARSLGFVPKTMRGKALVRRVLFGRLPRMPRDISDVDLPYSPPTPIPVTVDRVHRFLYLAAERTGP
jgi:SAM-dependent methyltransferase